MKEFIRFCIVGGLCTGLDALIFYVVILFTTYQVALVTSYLLCLVVNYLLNVYWTFNSKANKRNAIGIVTAHLINLFVIRMGLMFLFVDIINLSQELAYIPTLGISVVANFIMVKFALILANNREKQNNDYMV